MAADLSKISRDNLTAKVFQQIKEAIMSGRFQPGERLPIRNLAKKMGTSITPVREALLKLVSFGALEMKPAHPITIPILNKERYLENRTLRIANEGLGAAEAAKKIKKRHLNRLIKIDSDMNKAAREKKFADAIASNYLFHLELCKAAEMPALLEIVEVLWLRIGPSLNMLNSPIPEYNPKTISNFHKQIIEALENRDSDAAKAAIEQDLIQGGASLLAYFNAQSF